VEVTVRDLRRDFEPEILDRLYADVLAPNFVPEELDSPTSIAQSLMEGRGGLAWAAMGPDDEVLGGLVAERHPGSEVLLGGYLASRPDVRGRGVGAALVHVLRAHCAADSGVRLALGEVHDPRHDHGHGDRPLDRLRFMERHGARLLDVPFVQPALREGAPRVPGFLLIAVYVDPDIASEGGIPAEIVSRFVRSYYATTEGATEPFDAELTALLERIERHAAIALLPMSDYARVIA
jgi:GNAT superfamily N-acetyltransferase